MMSRDGERGNSWKSKRWLAGVVCALLLAVLAVGFFLWAPWEAGQDGSDATQDSTSEIQDVSDAEQEQSETNDETAKSESGNNALSLSEPDPSRFSSEEEAELYEETWHYDGAMRNKYGVKTITEESGASYVAGEVIAYFSLSVSDERIEEIAEDIGGSVVEIKDDAILELRQALLCFEDEDDVRAIAQELSALSEVESAQVNPVASISWEDSSAEITSVGLDPLAVGQTYLTASQFVEAWSNVGNAQTSVVAVLDSGIDFTHEDIGDNVDVERAYDSIEARALTENDWDLLGHGTAVSGVISAVANNNIGIKGATNNHASILPIRVANAWGTIVYDDVVEAFDYIISLDVKPDVINMSFAGVMDDENLYCGLQAKIEYLVSEYDVICVASSGNGGSNDATWPASFQGVVGVSSIDAEDLLSTFSNTGNSVDMCAPGENVYTTLSTKQVSDSDQDYGYWTGTSFSAPQVAAAAALIKAKYPDATADEIEQALELSARDLGTSGRDDEYGWGALDAAAALELMDEWRDSGDTSPNTGGSIYDAWDSLLGRVGLFALPEERLVGIAA